MFHPFRTDIQAVLCERLIHFIATFIKLLKPGGVKVVMAETKI
jgi:hypothetical protein